MPAQRMSSGRRTSLVWLDGAPTAAASIGQVHRGRWLDHTTGEAREVAVKVQYPGAGEALMSELRQLSRLARGVAPVFPGLDIKPLVAELQARAADELDYHLKAEAQSAYAEAFEGHPDISVPPVVAVGGEVLVTEWMDSAHSLAHVIREGTQEERDHYGELFVRFLFEGPRLTGMLHADPHPGNFRIVPGEDGRPDRLGVLDYGAVARLPEGELPRSLGRLMQIALLDDYDEVVKHLRIEGFIKPHIRVRAEDLKAYLGPFVDPARAETFRFSRDYMRSQLQRLSDPAHPETSLAFRLNLPPEYLLIHRTFVGGVGVLCQLEAEVPFRQLLTELMPGFTDPL